MNRFFRIRWIVDGRSIKTYKYSSLKAYTAGWQHHALFTGGSGPIYEEAAGNTIYIGEESLNGVWTQIDYWSNAATSAASAQQNLITLLKTI